MNLSEAMKIIRDFSINLKKQEVSEIMKTKQELNF
jgi:hypothetical protein